MFDEPLPKGSRLPESPRINALLAGLMGSSSPQPSAPPPSLSTAQVMEPSIEPAHAPKTMIAKPFKSFLKSIQWAYVPATESLVIVTPGMPVREFFRLVNWSGEKGTAGSSFGGSIAPPSVENMMSQFSWD